MYYYAIKNCTFDIQLQMIVAGACAPDCSYIQVTSYSKDNLIRDENYHHDIGLTKILAKCRKLLSKKGTTGIVGYI